MTGRPRTAIGTYGTINVIRRRNRRFTAKTRYCDLDPGDSRSGAISDTIGEVSEPAWLATPIRSVPTSPGRTSAR